MYIVLSVCFWEVLRGPVDYDFDHCNNVHTVHVYVLTDDIGSGWSWLACVSQLAMFNFGMCMDMRCAIPDG